MRHRNKPKVGKGGAHGRKLLRTLVSSLFLYEKITTTLAQARVAKSYAEKAITKAKTGTLHARRLLLADLTPMAVKKAMEILGPKYKDRNGGFIRMIKLSHPASGRATAMLELVE